MQIQTKLFRWPDKGNHVIVIVRGLIGSGGLEWIFDEVASATRFLPDSKVLIDLIDATSKLAPTEIGVFVNSLNLDSWSHSPKIALVSPPAIEQYDQLATLSACLSSRGLQIAVFYDSKLAIDWLSDKT
jgi:hypothetical protein